MKDTQEVLSELFTAWSGQKPEVILPLPSSGSSRRYFRLKSGDSTAIGAMNPVIAENKAFITLSSHFGARGFRVPAVYNSHRDGFHYLQQDLGDTSVSAFITNERQLHGINKATLDVYRKLLDDLAGFQTRGLVGLDTSFFFPRESFDKRAIGWDLNYFKYAFLRAQGLEFDEDRLEDDFEELLARAGETSSNYFMYRDFQTRNMMLYHGEIYYIDYQGGRKGPLAYDPASLLFSSRANLPPDVRKDLFHYYLERIAADGITDPRPVEKQFPLFALLRILQMLGAYGFRGYFEGKQHFLDSVPYALKNLDGILAEVDCNIPEIRKLSGMAASQPEIGVSELPLVAVQSFSYKKGIPPDTTGNGGGFVFDCRALPNPGREEMYKQLTGKDEAVIRYLESYPEVRDFLENTYRIVSQSVRNYNQRGFTNLSVSFGCTGGQHRSVYCTQKLAQMLQDRLRAIVNVKHNEI